MISDSEGNILNDHREISIRWKEYIEALHNDEILEEYEALEEGQEEK